MSQTRREFMQTLAILGATFVVPVGHHLVEEIPNPLPRELEGMPTISFRPDGSKDWVVLGTVDNLELQKEIETLQLVESSGRITREMVTRVEFFMDLTLLPDVQPPIDATTWMVSHIRYGGARFDWTEIHGILTFAQEHLLLDGSTELGAHLALLPKPGEDPFGQVLVGADLLKEARS